MRKLFSCILVIGMMLLLCMPAFADGRGPAFTSYDVVCVKETPRFRENWEDESGTMEQQGTFPAGTKLTVDYEYELNGVLYGSVWVGSEEDGTWYYVRMSDVELQDDTYLPENAMKLDDPRSVRVIGKGGIPMYAGPNTRYDKVMTIPRGTKLTYSYGNDADDYYRTWAYVTYLGRSGWIYVYRTDTKNGVAELPDAGDSAEIWVLSDDVQMYDGISFGNMENEIAVESDWIADAIRENHEEPDRVVGTLEKGKRYTYRYSHGQDYGTWYYVTVGLRTGWVFMSDDTSRVAASADKEDRERFLSYKTSRLKLRESPDEDAKGTTVSIEKNTVFGADYTVRSDYTQYYYMTVDGQSGWFTYDDARQIAASSLLGDAEYGFDRTNESDSAAPIYSDIMQRGKSIGQIPAGAKYAPLYCAVYETQTDEENSEYTWFYYVRYNGVTGWIDEDDISAQYEDDAEDEDERDDSLDDEVWDGDGEWDSVDWLEDDTPQEADEDEREEETVFTDESSAPQSGLSALQVVLICVGGAAILALTAAVTLLLIRRKRKEKALPVPAEDEITQMPDETTQVMDETTQMLDETTQVMDERTQEIGGSFEDHSDTNA